eukprot:CAMPEP_0196730888 /NCGR_PEP_ID=MMETSP1091-20130531/10815_1 /TAXON_ID=302021 /ORGANISM="Rhodomonas sp., Strain CCMP768" /LENGTH=71 /DNA_ID=CAMNT_0042073971 /DNA_START=54 /DNA_END=266 /DNA_ORIENTATION=+
MWLVALAYGAVVVVVLLRIDKRDHQHTPVAHLGLGGADDEAAGCEGVGRRVRELHESARVLLAVLLDQIRA